MTDVVSAGPTAPRWRPLSAIDRRLLGVLAEKAKTTPDTYPMSLNAVVSGCNQKSNRAPVMQLEAEDAQESLDRLREFGAVGMVEGYGRVTKYRHYLYEWLGVEKLELSVMTELLLRGAQTEGDLRSRASRMDPIADLPALWAILGALKAKGLVIPLTPEGRGHVVSHALYSARELERVKAEFAAQALAAAAFEREPPVAETAPPRTAAPVAGGTSMGRPAETESLGRQIDELRALVGQLRAELEEVSAQQQRMDEELRGLRDALGG